MAVSTQTSDIGIVSICYVIFDILFFVHIQILLTLSIFPVQMFSLNLALQVGIKIQH